MSDLIKPFIEKSERNDLFSDAEIADLLPQADISDKTFVSFFDGLKDVLLKSTKAHIDSNAKLPSIAYSYASPGSRRMQAMRAVSNRTNSIGQPVRILGSFQRFGKTVKGVVLEREAVASGLKAALNLDELALPLNGYNAEDEVALQHQFSARVDAVMLGLMTVAARYELPIHLSGTGLNPLMMEAVQRLKVNHEYHTQCIAVVSSLDEKLKRAGGVMNTRPEMFNTPAEVKDMIIEMDPGFWHGLPCHLAFADDYKVLLSQDDDILVVAERVDGQFYARTPELVQMLREGFAGKGSRIDLARIEHDDGVAIYALER